MNGAWAILFFLVKSHSGRDCSCSLHHMNSDFSRLEVRSIIYRIWNCKFTIDIVQLQTMIWNMILHRGIPHREIVELAIECSKEVVWKRENM